MLADNMAVPCHFADILRMGQLCREIWEMGWDISGAQGGSAALQYAALGEDLRALDDSLQLLEIQLRIEEQVSPREELQAVRSALRDLEARMAAMEYRPVWVGPCYFEKASMAPNTFVIKEYAKQDQEWPEEIMVRVNLLAQRLSYFQPNLEYQTLSETYSYRSPICTAVGHSVVPYGGSDLTSKLWSPFSK